MRDRDCWCWWRNFCRHKCHGFAKGIGAHAVSRLHAAAIGPRGFQAAELQEALRTWHRDRLQICNFDSGFKAVGWEKGTTLSARLSKDKVLEPVIHMDLHVMLDGGTALSRCLPFDKCAAGSYIAHFN